MPEIRNSRQRRPPVQRRTGRAKRRGRQARELDRANRVACPLWLATALLFLGAFAVSVPAAEEKPAPFRNYTQEIPGSSVSFEMVAIPGGESTIGSAGTEPGREATDAPRRKVRIEPFWMGKCEVGWPEFLQYVYAERTEVEQNKDDGITHPTKPHASVYRQRSEKGTPAMGMSLQLATEYCKWLSKKTGVRYGLPTEAEWEHACRAGATTAYFWGDDPARAGEYAWFKDNAHDTYQPVGTKLPNRFGVHDLAGNVAEWCARETDDGPAFAKGGAFTTPVSKLRCGARMIETPEWNELDPQNPPSAWWLSAADFVGFRVVRSFAAEGRGN